MTKFLLKYKFIIILLCIGILLVPTIYLLRTYNIDRHFYEATQELPFIIYEEASRLPMLYNTEKILTVNDNLKSIESNLLDLRYDNKSLPARECLLNMLDTAYQIITILETEYDSDAIFKLIDKEEMLMKEYFTYVIDGK